MNTSRHLITATQQPVILKLDVAGVPIEWISWQTAAVLYSRDCVRWEAGETRFEVLGGNRRDGARSSMTLASIIAVQDRTRRHVFRPPPLNNRTLFARDGYICLYCGQKFSAAKLTRDHVVATSAGGADAWHNVVTACRTCNQAKGSKSVEEFRPLIALPYTPDPAAYLLLQAQCRAGTRRVTADQQAWIEMFAKKKAVTH